MEEKIVFEFSKEELKGVIEALTTAQGELYKEQLLAKLNGDFAKADKLLGEYSMVQDLNLTFERKLNQS